MVEYPFLVPDAGEICVRVANGSRRDTRASSASITVDGARLIGPSQLNQRVAAAEGRRIVLAGEHVLGVTLASAPDSEIAVELRFAPLATSAVAPRDGPEGGLRLVTMGSDPPIFTPNADGITEAAELWAALNALALPGLASGQHRYQIRYSFHVIAPETCREIRTLSGEQPVLDTSTMRVDVVWDGQDENGNAAPDGPYLVTVSSVFIRSGRNGEVEVDHVDSDAIAVILDTGGPAITILEPTVGADSQVVRREAAGLAVHLRALLYDPVGLDGDLIEVSLNDAPLDAAVSPGGVLTADFMLRSDRATPSFTNTLRLSASDRLGFATLRSIEIEVVTSVVNDQLLVKFNPGTSRDAIVSTFAELDAEVIDLDRPDGVYHLQVAAGHGGDDPMALAASVSELPPVQYSLPVLPVSSDAPSGWCSTGALEGGLGEPEQWYLLNSDDFGLLDLPDRDGGEVRRCEPGEARDCANPQDECLFGYCYRGGSSTAVHLDQPCERHEECWQLCMGAQSRCREASGELTAVPCLDDEDCAEVAGGVCRPVGVCGRRGGAAFDTGWTKVREQVCAAKEGPLVIVADVEGGVLADFRHVNLGVIHELAKSPSGWRHFL